MALINCYECNKEISDKAKVCPNCGAKNLIKKNKMRFLFKGKRPLILITVFIILIASYVTYFLFFANCDGNCINGYGTYYYEDGDKYVGEWKYGQKHGYGTLEYSYFDGNVNKSVGLFKYDEFTDGVEIEKHADQIKHNTTSTRITRGHVISCTNGELNGQGVKTFASGDIYRGRFKNGRRGDGDGYFMSLSTPPLQYGSMIPRAEILNPENWTANGKFKGDIKVNDMRWYLSKIYLVNKDRSTKRPLTRSERKVFLIDSLGLQGKWRDGIKEFIFDGGREFNNAGVVYDNGNKYYGDLSDGIRSGDGEMFYASGKHYLGDWENDLPHGDGMLFCHTSWECKNHRNKHYYNGQFKNGKPHGNGEMIFLNYPTELKGLFENGKFIGK